VRVKCPPLRVESRRLAGALDLGRQLGDWLARLDAGPQRAAIPPVEAAYTADCEVEARQADSPKRVGKIVGKRPFDFADEAQCQVEIVFAHPA
jgi:hypothetical protein